jgi:hypothetical protein
MAGRGPAPKESRSRARDEKRREADVTTVSSDGQVRGPDLPDTLEWHARTRAWWETWRRSPQSQAFTDTDWSFLIDTALMHDAMWSKGQWTLAAEVRLRVAKFGATPEDRARLKMSVGEPQSSAAPQRARNKSAVARRDRILRAVADDDV